MNLKEYLNQEEPVRQIKVFLNPSEFHKGETDLFKGGKYTRITVNAYPQFDYFLKGNEGFLFALNAVGNPERKSCFYIEDQKELRKKIFFEDEISRIRLFYNIKSFKWCISIDGTKYGSYDTKEIAVLYYNSIS